MIKTLTPRGKSQKDLLVPKNPLNLKRISKILKTIPSIPKKSFDPKKSHKSQNISEKPIFARYMLFL